MTTTAPTDTIDAILATALDEAGRERVAAIRRHKPELAAELRAYDEAVFRPDPASAAALPAADRFVLAVRVASHTHSRAVVDWYAHLAAEAGASTEVVDRARDVGAAWTDGSRLAAAIRHADKLTTRPATTGPEDVAALKTAGWSPAAIMALSQVVAFVSYQLRLIAALRALGENR
jgi:uncharacterized protein YciW